MVRDIGWSVTNLTVWGLILAFLAMVVYSELKPRKTPVQNNGKQIVEQQRKTLAENIRLCAINAPKEDCERVFLCDDDPCYCSVCD